MEYKNVTDLLDDTTNQPSKFRARNWIEINDESGGMYNDSNQIKFKTTIINSDLCDYTDAYTYVKGIITFPNISGQGAALNNRNENIIFKICALSTNCIMEQIMHKWMMLVIFYVLTPLFNLIHYSDIYSKALEILWQYYKCEPALNDNNIIIGFPNDDNNSIFFKQQITRQARNSSTNNEMLNIFKCWIMKCWNNGSIKISK